MSTELRNFLSLPYDELEDLNLKAKEQRQNRTPVHKIQEERLKYLTNEKRIKAVTVLFSDLEGRLHMLDYDKKFLLKSWDNLTFDGSSIRGFTAQRESDLRLGIDWGSFYWAPADYFGNGKVLVFGEVIDKDGSPYSADIRGVLKGYAESLHKKEGYTLNAANEIEGFLFKSPDAERHYNENGKFEYVNTGGYYHSLPGDPLRTFIDTTAEVQRAMGFQNEKDHPEVAPSQFEINYSYSEVVNAADQIQLYKLICRQVANKMGLSAGQVAMTIPARPDSAVDGRLRPGDTVQVLVTVVDKTRNEAHTRQILDRAQVFEVGRDQSFGSSGTTAETDGLARGSIASVTLAISADQARQLAEARRTGELDVLLLPPPEVAHP